MAGFEIDRRWRNSFTRQARLGRAVFVIDILPVEVEPTPRQDTEDSEIKRLRTEIHELKIRLNTHQELEKRLHMYITTIILIVILRIVLGRPRI